MIRAGMIAAVLVGFGASLGSWAHAGEPVIHERGNLPIRAYTPLTYKAAPLVHEMVQDSRGVLFAACSGGVLEYDGTSWNLIPHPRGFTVRSKS